MEPREYARSLWRWSWLIGLVMVLTVEDSNPKRAANVANEIVKVFGRQNQELQANRYASSKQNLQQALAAVQAETDRAQSQLDGLGTPTTSQDVAEQQPKKSASRQLQRYG